MLKLKIITPKKIVVEREVASLTIPSAEGELTILPRHTKLFTLLTEGIITIRTNTEEEYMAIGGGYFQTDGLQVQILVSRAYNQGEIDESITQKALEDAKKLLSEAKDENQKIEASTLIRRSMIDLKLIKKRKRVH